MDTLCAQLFLQFYSDYALKICMWLGYTRKIIFDTFLQFECSHLLLCSIDIQQADSMKKMSKMISFCHFSVAENTIS